MKSIFSVHTGVGGAPLGVEHYEAMCEAGGTVICKSVNNAGIVMRAAQVAAQYPGRPHCVVMRWTNPGEANYHDIPDYSLHPKDAAQLFMERVRWEYNRAPELHDLTDQFFIQVVNEPRTHRDNNNPNYDDMHPVNWLGAFGLEAVRIADMWNWRLALFGFNAGTPKPDDWEQPRMLELLQRLNGGTQHIIGVNEGLHDNEWNGFDYRVTDATQYMPYWISRAQFCADMCKRHNIPSPYFAATEFAWNYSNIPSHSKCLDDLEVIMPVYARWGYIGAFLWSNHLSNDTGTVRDQMNAFLPTLKTWNKTMTFDDVAPPDVPGGDTTVWHLSFENGWSDDPTQPDRRQVPNGFSVEVVENGDMLPFPQYGERRATGTVECKHLVCGDTLGSEQCVDGDDPLVLSGRTTFKIQAVAMATGTRLSTVIDALPNGQPLQSDDHVRVTIPINAHYQAPDIFDRVPPLEAGDMVVAVWVNGEVESFIITPELVDRTWLYPTVEFYGAATVTLCMQTSWRNSRDLFTDNWSIIVTRSDMTQPDNSLHSVIVEQCDMAQCTPINADAMLQKVGLQWNDGRGAWVPVTDELYLQHEDRTFICQKFEYTGSHLQRYVYTELTIVNDQPQYSTPVAFGDGISTEDTPFTMIKWPVEF